MSYLFSKWHRRFAWWPTWINDEGQWIWLRFYYTSKGEFDEKAYVEFWKDL